MCRIIQSFLLSIFRSQRKIEDIELDVEIDAYSPCKWRKGTEVKATSLADHGSVAVLVCLGERRWYGGLPSVLRGRHEAEAGN